MRIRYFLSKESECVRVFKNKDSNTIVWIKEDFTSTSSFSMDAILYLVNMGQMTEITKDQFDCLIAWGEVVDFPAKKKPREKKEWYYDINKDNALMVRVDKPYLGKGGVHTAKINFDEAGQYHEPNHIGGCMKTDYKWNNSNMVFFKHI